MIYLALYKGRGLIDNYIVRWWTRSIYSHCELVIDGVCYSSSRMDGGVRSKYIDLRSEHWDLIELPDFFRQRILTYYHKTKEDRYGWLDLLRAQVLNRASNQTGAAFCSEWCAEALGLPNPTMFSPHTLGELIRVITSHTWQNSG